MAESHNMRQQVYTGPERRVGERRTGMDRREAVRWEPAKPERRALGIGSNRRRTVGALWGPGLVR
jgi:hypothetical protein